MKKMAKKLKLVIIVAMIAIPGALIAQPDMGDGGDDVDDVPLDGGVSLLVAAGLGYGLKKVYDKKREEKDGDVIEK